MADKTEMQTKGIIFDLDGTLVDTLDDLTVSMNYGLRRFGCPERSRDDCRDMIGSGILKFAESALGPEYKHLAESLVEVMIEHYRDHCLVKTVPYPGFPDVLRTLHQMNIRLAILTNKNQQPAEVITRHFFGDIFATIIGAKNGQKPKPDPQAALKILELWNLEPQEVLFVGDSEADIQTAEAANVRCVACEWGFRSKTQLLAAGAKMFIQHPKQILDLVT